MELTIKNVAKIYKSNAADRNKQTEKNWRLRRESQRLLSHDCDKHGDCIYCSKVEL